MIDLQKHPKGAWNALFGIMCLLSLLAVWFVLAPTPTLTADAKEKHELSMAKSDTAYAQHRSEQAKAAIAQKTWNLGVEELGSKTLRTMNKLAADHKVQIANFRAEKPNAAASLLEVPFVVVVEGSFTDVGSFIDEIEGPKSKIAVNLVQISSSNTGADRITATLGLIGFLAQPEAK